MRPLILQRRKSSAYLDFEDDNKFEDDPNGNIPQYAALSYGWGDETEMMSSQEIDYPRLSSLTKVFETLRLDAGDKQTSTESSVLEATPGTTLPQKQTEKSRMMYCTYNSSPTKGVMTLKTMSYQYQNAGIRGEQSSTESFVFGIIAKVVAVWKRYHQFSSILGLLCKGEKSNFPRNPTRFSNENVAYHLNEVCQIWYGFIPEASGPLVLKNTNLFVGDGEIGPQAGPPSMGREDDDDDDCVGFHKFSRLNRSSKMVDKGAQLQARLNICNLHMHSKCATIPKYGPPKRDPVAAAIMGTVRQSLDASTLSTWRDVISRTCGGGADPYSANAKVLQGSSWQSAVPYCQLSTTS